MTTAIVLDTSALIALLLKEPDAELIASALVSATAIRMAAPNWLEVAMVAMARRGIDGYQQLKQILERLQVEVVASDRANAEIAFQAWIQYGKGRHPAGLNYGDYFAYALAKQRGEALLYKGNDFSKTDIQSVLTFDD
jgi:ribonuclease VapC